VLKKIICLVTVLVIVFSFAGCKDSEFLVHGKDDLSAIINMSESEIDAYCEENNITYFAVNADNTKQIKRIEVMDEFAKEVKDLNILTDVQICEMAPELSTFSDALGEVVYRGEYKLLKTEYKTKDNGGEYVITQFVTVKNSKRITLSFCTEANIDREYIDDVLEEQFSEEFDYRPLVNAGAIVFFLIAVVSAVLILRDVKNNNN
jgi:hypothetical protein